MGGIDNKSSQKEKIQEWLLNIVILSLAIVIIGFMFSTGERLLTNKDKVDLNQIKNIDNEYNNVMVEVLNGCGVSGLANKYSNYLRQQGLDVIYVGNAEDMDHKKTKAIMRVKNKDKYKIFTDVSEFSERRIQKKTEEVPHADFSIILGEDYKDLKINSKIEN